ncbi:MAG: FAD-dependent oxidoreductase [Candidatus Woesearchaeota archaeon]
MKKIVIIGGGSAGVTAATTIRKKDHASIITILEASRHHTYSLCSLPYLVGKEIKNINDIEIFDKKFFEDMKINYMLNANAINIDRKNKVVDYNANGKVRKIKYDKLVLTIGAEPLVPKINNLKNYYCLKKKEDAIALRKNARKNKTAVIIGGGIIGIELAMVLRKRGMKVIIIEICDTILPFLDKDISDIIEKKLEKMGVKLFKNCKYNIINNKSVEINGNKFRYSMIIVTCGVASNTSLALGTKLKAKKGILVNKSMQTEDKDIYAAGDCVEVKGVKNRFEKLATNAIKQGIVVGENILGNRATIDDPLNTWVTKLDDLIVGSTGYSQEMLKNKKIKSFSGIVNREITSKGFPDNRMITVKVVSDSKGRIKGCQIIGDAEVVGRLNWVALAIRKKIKVDDMIRSEIAYNPAVSAIHDPVILACEILSRKIKRKNG